MLDAILETLQDCSLTNSLKNVSEKEQEVFKVLGDYLARSPIMTSKDLQELLGVSPTTARCYLSGFAQKGLLEVSGSTKGKSYSIAQN